MKNVIVIGGGPAGMIAAGVAAESGKCVTLLEKNNKLGKKLYITGKGRCNVTNVCDIDEFLNNTPSNPYFLYSSLYSFDCNSTIDFFEKLDVPIKVERGNRAYPASDKASDIVKALEKYMNKNKVTVKCYSQVKKLIIGENKINGVEMFNGEKILADSVIVATGGLSYPVTGSTGDGYNFARQAGHNVSKLYPSLVPIKTKENWCSELQGLSLKNVSITVRENKKVIYQDFGEMIFTHYGVSGPIILSASRYLAGKYNNHCTISIDLKPALDEKEMDNRLLGDFEKFHNKDFKNSLDNLLPQKLIPVIIELCEIDPNKKVNLVTKEERQRLKNLIKNLTCTVVDHTGYSEAVVTAGGVFVDEIDPSTMESKLVSGLYFCGEVLDVDSFTGGFNLQIAFSTGYLAGLNS